MQVALVWNVGASAKMELVDKFCHYLCVCSYRVLAYDHGLMSFVDVAFHSWPVVLVTNPKNALFLVPGHEPTHRIKRSTYIRSAYLFLFVLKTTDSLRVPTPPGKSLNCVCKLSRTWKVLESEFGPVQ